MPEKDVKIIAKQLFNALQYLHSGCIVHRDIKLENILVTDIDQYNKSRRTIKLADFGLAKQLDHNDLPNEKVGSLSYMAPEVINRKPYDTRVDIWSACVVLYVLLSGEQPFYAESKSLTQKAITERDIHFSERKWHGIS